MEEAEADITKKCPSLPPNYVSLAQLQERWIQQQQQKQKEQVASENQQQPKEKERFDRNRRSSKNSKGGTPADGVNVCRNGERRLDSRRVHLPRRQSDGNHREIGEAKGLLKSEILGLRASSDEKGNRTGNAISVKERKHNRKMRRPRVKKGLNGEDQVQNLPENGEKSGAVVGKSGGKEGYTGNVERNGYEEERVRENEILALTMVGSVPEIKEKEVKPEHFSRKSHGKQVLNDQLSSTTDSWRFEANSSAKQLVNGQFSSSSKDWRIGRKSRGKQVDKGQFLSNADDTSIRGSVNECKEDVWVGSRVKKGQKYHTEYERGGDDIELVEEGNVCTLEVLQDNEVEEEVQCDESRKTGKDRLTGEFLGNWKMKRNSNYNKVQLERGQQLEEGGSLMVQNERNGPKATTAVGVCGYGNDNGVSHYGGPKIRRDFGYLSLGDSRKGNSIRGQRGSYRNHGRFAPQRKGKEVNGGLVWVKKEEISDRNAAEML